MIYAVDNGNRAAYRLQLERFRRGGRKLRAQHTAGIFCGDEFETRDTVHLLRLDAFGGLASGLELNPTTGPHFLSTVLDRCPQMARAPVSHSIYEFTHYFAVGGDGPARRKRRVCGELLVAMFEFGFSIGLSDISVCSDASLLRTALELDWRILPLGPSLPLSRGGGIPLLLEVSLDAADRTREGRGITGPVLTYAPAPPPYAANENQRIRLACSRD